MKKKMLSALVVLFFASSQAGLCFDKSFNVPAEEALMYQVIGMSEMSESASETVEGAKVAINEVSQPQLSLPVVEDTRKIQPPKAKSKKIDLKAVIFDPNAKFDAEAIAEDREMTRLEEAQTKVHEALHGKVEKLSTKGLLADKMKINIDGKYVDNIQPWIDYNGYFSNIWSNGDYKNTLYGINFADVGFHVNTKDDVYHMKFMISPVKGFDNKTYFQALFADNYITRKIGKHNQILLGHTWLPLGFEGQVSPLCWQFFGRSQTSLNYASTRTLGARLSGSYKYADYKIGFYSAGRSFRDWFPGPEFASWVEFKPLANLNEEKYGKLRIGAGFNAGNAEGGNYKVGIGGVNYEYKRLRATTEFGMSDGANGALGYKSTRTSGINGTLAYRITPKLEIVGRYDEFDPNTEIANNKRTEYTAGINYYIKDYAARLMLNYVMYSVENGTYGSRILVGTQIVL